MESTNKHQITKMNAKQMIQVPELAKITKRYSHAIRVPLDSNRDLVFIGGQLPKDLEGRVVGIGDPEAQARAVFANLEKVLEAAGGDLQDLVSITIYLKSTKDFPAISKVRDALFTDYAPSSSVVEVTAVCREEYLLEVSGTAVIYRNTSE